LITCEYLVWVLAVDEGRLEIVDYLLGAGLDVNTKFPYSVINEEEWDSLGKRYDCGHMEASLVEKEMSAVVSRELSHSNSLGICLENNC
jgi:hypothetical protein